MTDDDVDLLALIGRVVPPTSATLEAAREALWSAVAEEMLSIAGSETTQQRKALPADRTRRRRGYGTGADS